MSQISSWTVRALCASGFSSGPGHHGSEIDFTAVDERRALRRQKCSRHPWQPSTLHRRCNARQRSLVLCALQSRYTRLLTPFGMTNVRGSATRGMLRCLHDAYVSTRIHGGSKGQQYTPLVITVTCLSINIPRTRN